MYIGCILVIPFKMRKSFQYKLVFNSSVHRMNSGYSICSHTHYLYAISSPDVNKSHTLWNEKYAQSNNYKNGINTWTAGVTVCGLCSLKFTCWPGCTTKCLCWRHKLTTPMQYVWCCTARQTSDWDGGVKCGWIHSSSSIQHPVMQHPTMLTQSDEQSVFVGRHSQHLTHCYKSHSPRMYTVSRKKGSTIFLPITLLIAEQLSKKFFHCQTAVSF